MSQALIECKAAGECRRGSGSDGCGDNDGDAVFQAADMKSTNLKSMRVRKSREPAIEVARGHDHVPETAIMASHS
jgi:hypothetical protein